MQVEKHDASNNCWRKRMNFEKKTSVENLLITLSSDLIGRNRYLLKLIRLLTHGGGNKFFSLDGEWGTGKTFFVKQLDLLVNYCNSYDDGKIIKENTFTNNSPCLIELKESRQNIVQMEELLKKNTLKDLKAVIQEKSLYSVYFNAWEHDDEEDPLISIIYQLINNYSHVNSKGEIVYSGNFDLLKQVVKIVSSGVIDIGNIINVEDFAKEIKRKNRVKELIADVFDSIICENCNHLIIIIDEIDRCKPTYAVKLLERMRHYIHDDRLTVLVSTNLKELQHTINALYGANFNSSKYLSKFFDSRLILPNIDSIKYASSFPLKTNMYTDSWFSLAVSTFIEYTADMTMRDIERYLTNLRFFETYAFKDKSRVGSRAISVLLDLLILPYTVGLYSLDQNKYLDFINGKGYEEFVRFIKWEKHLISFLVINLYSYEEEGEIENDVLFEEFEKIYNALFVKKVKSEEVNAGKLKFYYGTLSYFLNNISLLSDLAELEQREVMTN